jgi:hypothetical protein
MSELTHHPEPDGTEIYRKDLEDLIKVIIGEKQITNYKPNGVKVYRALLTSDSDHLTPDDTVVLENTLGGVPVWSRLEAGNYKATLAGAFPVSKTFVSVSACYDGADGAGFSVMENGAARDGDKIILVTFEARGSSPGDWNGGGEPTTAINVEILVFP